MTLLKFFRLYAPEPDAGGTDTAVIDRGDDLDIDPENPDADLPVVEPKKDPKVQELEAELEAEDEPVDDKKKNARIPLARHEAVLNKEREKRVELERQLAQFQKGGEIAELNVQLNAAESEIAKLDTEYNDLLTDGENAKAAAVMAKIRVMERQMAEVKSDQKIQAMEIRATERARYNTTLERIEASYPSLNPDHEDYNDETMGEVAELKSAYELKGLTPTAALQKAVKYVVGAETRKQEAATEVTPNVTEKDVAAERKKDAVAKTTKAVAKTPPSLSRTGLDSDKLGGGADSASAVMRMSQKEFAQLSDSVLAKLRGDELS